MFNNLEAQGEAKIQLTIYPSYPGLHPFQLTTVKSFYLHSTFTFFLAFSYSLILKYQATNYPSITYWPRNNFLVASRLNNLAFTTIGPHKVPLDNSFKQVLTLAEPSIPNPTCD